MEYKEQKNQNLRKNKDDNIHEGKAQQIKPSDWQKQMYCKIIYK